jgi:glycosyltransferase involved in cell wall biosynthesis
MHNPLSVIIPCRNERRNIRPCVESVRPVAGEILVADSGSTDGTLEIVQSLGGCRIIEREYVHSGDFKNWAILHARHPWVLIVDADERLTASMVAEINHLFATGPQADGYWVHRENYFMGHRVRYSGWQTDRVLRLFRRDQGRYVGDTDHAEVAIASHKVGRLKARLTHYTYWNYRQLLNKMQRYTEYQAQQWDQQGRRASMFKLLLTGPSRFALSYLLRGGFLDGIVGFQICVLTGYYSFLKQARLWQLQHGKLQPDPETASAQTRSHREAA